MGRVSEFSIADLHSLCSEAQTRTIDPIVAALVHGDDGSRAAGVLLINAITSEDQRSEAIGAMIREFPGVGGNISRLASMVSYFQKL